MPFILPRHKTKIVCTIGPAVESEFALRRLMRRGMNVARLNFSHGTQSWHAETIRRIRSAAGGLGLRVPILADLPGPKIRIGRLATEPLPLKRGALVTLSGAEDAGLSGHIPVHYPSLHESLRPGSRVYLSDGFIELRVREVVGQAVVCRVMVGGALYSGKGLNLPGAPLKVDPLTAVDREWLGFGLAQGLTLFGVSFVERAEDILRVRAIASAAGRDIRVVAKIERAAAVAGFDAILAAADGIMIARGDLGVEIPIEEVPVVQKDLIRRANLACRPVITATQMLESMVTYTRPTRAEVTDVANAILDGTDAVMLSEETAVGRYPAEAVRMMVRIASSVEKRGAATDAMAALRGQLRAEMRKRRLGVPDVISLNVIEAAEILKTRCILTPTQGGNTSRRISRFRPASWILAFTPKAAEADFLALSSGVLPSVRVTTDPRWFDGVLTELRAARHVKTGERVLLTQGQFAGEAGGTDAMGILTV